MNIPNEGLVEKLYNDYYLVEDANPYISSHWNKHSKRFKVKGDSFYCHIGDITGTPIRRLLHYFCIRLYLSRLPHKEDILRLFPASVKVLKSLGFYFSYDIFRQVCSLELIMRNMSREMKSKHLNVLMIGDGQGFLSSLFKEVFLDSTIFLVDIGKTLLFQSINCQKTHPSLQHMSVDEDYDSVDFIYCPTEELEQMEGIKFDVAVNINSMQEMNALTVEQYFTFMRNWMNEDNLFYCCNRERKEMVGGEVSEFYKYPWDSGDIHLLDELCPWTEFFVAYRWYANSGPKLFGIRIPFTRNFDGPILHRLTVLNTEIRE